MLHNTTPKIYKWFYLFIRKSYQVKRMSYTSLELNGKVAVVIGGTSGIGRAIAHGLADAGADVVTTSRRIEQVEATAKEIEEKGKRTLRIASDVSDRASLQNLLDETVKVFGKVGHLLQISKLRVEREIANLHVFGHALA